MAFGGAPRRSQQQRRSESEEALLAAASQLIAERGIERTSLARVGELAGASRGLPSHHFGSKEGLLARVAERAQERSTAATEAGVRRVGAHADQIPVLDRLAVLVDVYLGRLERPSPEARALITIWGSTFPSESSLEVMTAADQRAYVGLADLVREGQEQGSIRADVDPTGAAAFLLGLMRGVGALLLTKPEAVDFSAVRSTCRDVIVSALTAAPANGNGRRDGRAAEGERVRRRT